MHGCVRVQLYIVSVVILAGVTRPPIHSRLQEVSRAAASTAKALPRIAADLMCVDNNGSCIIM